MLFSWPVRLLLTRAARAYGFLDPVALLAWLRRFAQPSEFAVPLELLRAGLVFHARGLINTRAIQHNLDWVWPYWVERQFNPRDPSFVPRAFSFSHINLTHRNWTAVGRPDVPFYPIVDPRGLVTPLYDGWSIDAWYIPREGEPFLPSRAADCRQELAVGPELVVRTEMRGEGVLLRSAVHVAAPDGEPRCVVALEAEAVRPGWLAVALRPYNPEGVSRVDRIVPVAEGAGWSVDGGPPVRFSQTPSRQVFSTYAAGDVVLRLADPAAAAPLACHAGMATAVALFDVDDLAGRPLQVEVPLVDELHPRRRLRPVRGPTWPAALQGLARLRIGDPGAQRLFDQAVAGLVLHAPGDVFPGPYTYKRFWFRDAAFLLHALLVLGDAPRVHRALGFYPGRQRRDGYFLSQEGEWDANGAALWILHRHAELTGGPLPEAWLRAAGRGADWIARKRLPSSPPHPEAGLLPAGFSAEHLGPNDFYYWDDFWGVAGLRAAAALLRGHDPAGADRWESEANDLLAAVGRSLPSGPHRRFAGALPAAPRRRMDSGAIGSLAADYPLQLYPPGHDGMLRTADYLRDHSSVGRGFFQQMIHSGINAYLTLHLAQVRLRAGQVEAAWALADEVAALASPTGQWPEAIHPRTGGGCMGDGQHLWASAEWVLFLRACFVREEPDHLVIAAGVRPEWWRDVPASFGPTPTRWGPVTVRVDGGVVAVDGAWRGAPPPLEVRLPSGPACPSREGAGG